nr:cache domain-containing protein [Kibdelosporangium sp. MJ126-NF4]CEL18704.1 hypothetical protein [Kibdelosporangium sp. MJ126-NF4]CTQ98188.1 hypothetical protein [Kibdelosporangium sp. MJ126-NF4]
MGVPSAVLLILLMLLAGFCFLQVREPATSAPEAVVESQRTLVESLSRSLAATAGQNAADLRTAVTVADPTAQPADLLAAVNQNQPKWRGMALLERSTRKQVVARGEPITLPESLPDTAVVPVAGPEGKLRLLVSVPMPGTPERVLVTSATAGIPTVPLDADLQQGLLLANRANVIVDSRGTVPKPDDAAAQSMLVNASTAASARQTGSSVGEAVGNDSGRNRRALVVSYAPVGTNLGLGLISVVRAPVAEAAPARQGLRPALALVVVTLLGFGLIRVTLVGPVRRLRKDALQVAGGKLKRRVRLSYVTETRRIASAFEYCRMKLRDGSKPVVKRRPTFPARIAVIIAALGLLAWSGWVVVTLGGGTARVPDSVVSGHRSQVGNTAETINRTVSDGLTDVRAIAGLHGTKDPGALSPVVRELADQDRFRSVYIIDQSGAVTGTSAGRPPLRRTNLPPPEPGIRLQDTDGRVPVLFAHVSLAGGKHTLVAEFDVDHLSDLLRRAPGRVRLVNSELRTLAATDGFIAFEQVTGEGARRGVTDALAKKPAARVDGEGRNRSVIAASLVDDLKWAVVSEKPVRELSLPGNEVRDGAILVALIGALLAVLLFGWHHLVLIRPLRAIAAVGKFADGKHKDVIYPQRQDEVGTIACCLEICRQALTEGKGRLGSVRRPKGAATDETVLLQRVPADKPRRRSGAEVPR